MTEAKKHVAIVGAGIVGASTAIWLQRDGHEVTLIDKAGPGEGTSFGNGGILAPSSVVPIAVPGLLAKAPRMLLSPDQPLFLKWSYLPKLVQWLWQYLRNANDQAVNHRAEALFALIGDSVTDHQALAEGTGAENWIKEADYLFIYPDAKQYERDAYAWSVRKSQGFEWDVLHGDAFSDYDPAYGPALTCAARLKNHGRITDPGQYVKALAKAVEAKGGKVLKGEVTDIVRDGGRVTGVHLAGQVITCDSVVVAAGAWSAPLTQKLGVKVPLESERGYHLDLWETNIAPRSPAMIASGKFVVTPMDGRVRLAGIVEFGGLSSPPSDAPFDLLKKNVKAAIPGLTWTDETRWMGHRPSLSDSIPVIGPAPNLGGAFFAFGHDHVGLTGGPKTGRLVSQIVSGQRPNINLAPYSPTRFQ